MRRKEAEKEGEKGGKEKVREEGIKKGRKVVLNFFLMGRKKEKE